MLTPSEIKKAYIAELKAYRKWFDKTKAQYGGEHPMLWGNTDHTKVMEWNAGFKMVERISGFTRKEIQEMENVAGIIRK